MSILHVDLNSFYAHCTILNSEGKYNVNMPLIVGGDPQKRHGIVLAATYVVKKLGVHAGMPLIKALQLCPDAIVVPPNYRMYMDYSDRFMSIVKQYSPLISRYGIDEAYINYNGCEHLFGSAFDVAHLIRNRVKNEIGLTVSVGVGDNPLMAKMGSDYKKPDAVTVVNGEFWQKNVMPMSVDKLMYVGKATAKRLNSMGIYTIGDLAVANQGVLSSIFGVSGNQLWLHANGIDKPWIEYSADSEQKSISQSCTLPNNIESKEELHAAVLAQIDDVAYRMRSLHIKASTVCVSVRYSDLTHKSRQLKRRYPTDVTDELYVDAASLADALYGVKPIRQVGVKLTDFISGGEQLSFIADELHEKRRKVERAVDSIRDRFGRKSIQRGTTVAQSEEDMQNDSFNPFNRM